MYIIRICRHYLLKCFFLYPSFNLSSIGKHVLKSHHSSLCHRLCSHFSCPKFVLLQLLRKVSMGQYFLNSYMFIKSSAFLCEGYFAYKSFGSCFLSLSISNILRYFIVFCHEVFLLKSHMTIRFTSLYKWTSLFWLDAQKIIVLFFFLKVSFTLKVCGLFWLNFSMFFLV